MRENLFEPWSDGVARVGLLFLVTGLAFIVGAFTLPATVGMGPIVLLALIGAGLALFGVGRLQSLRMERELDEVERVLEECAEPVRVLRIGLPDRFIDHGEQAQLLASAGLDAAGILRRIAEAIGERPARTSAVSALPSVTKLKERS